MNTVRDRILLFIAHTGMSVSAFERSIKVSQGYVKNISKSIGADVLERTIGEYSNLSRTWLLTGEGEMLNTQEGNDDAPKVVAMNSEEYEKAMKSGATLIPEYNTTFHAGSGIISESEALVAHWAIPGAPKNAHIVPMAGDSMQPKLMSGCKLLVKPCYFSSGLDIPFGNVFAIAVSDEFGGISTHVKVLKRHKEKDKETTHWVAHSINTDYDDFEIPITHVKALSIVVMTMSQYMIL